MRLKFSQPLTETQEKILLVNLNSIREAAKTEIKKRNKRLGGTIMSQIRRLYGMKQGMELLEQINNSFLIAADLYIKVNKISNKEYTYEIAYDKFELFQKTIKKNMPKELKGLVSGLKGMFFNRTLKQITEGRIVPELSDVEDGLRKGVLFDKPIFKGDKMMHLNPNDVEITTEEFDDATLQP